MVAGTQELVSNQLSRLDHHRQIVMHLLAEYADRPTESSIQTITIFDEKNNHYQLLDIGWDDTGHRVFQPILHLDLINNKIWIQENSTDWDIAKALVAAEISPSEIVLGMHFTVLRQLGDYAIE
jgi:XisI protein